MDCGGSWLCYQRYLNVSKPMLKVSLECIGEGRYDAAMAAIHVCGDVDSFIIIISLPRPIFDSILKIFHFMSKNKSKKSCETHDKRGSFAFRLPFIFILHTCFTPTSFTHHLFSPPFIQPLLFSTPASYLLSSCHRSANGTPIKSSNNSPNPTA